MNYWIWYASLPIKLNDKFKIIEKFKEPRQIYKATSKALRAVKEINENSYETILKNKDERLISRMEEYMNKNDIKYITILDENYPTNLKKIYDPPVLLFYKGNIELLKYKKIAVVGSRTATNYGMNTAFRISKELSKKYVIISGLARGIDSAAHNGSIYANGKTIAVVGNGLDTIYPKENTNLFKSILKNGLIISEYVVGSKPMPSNFPERNRIISGLSSGVIVVEAAKKSGSLITADLALEQGKTVYAVPGNIDSLMSVGTNELIRNGAVPYTGAQDLEE